MTEQPINFNSSIPVTPTVGWRRALRLRLSERKLLLVVMDLMLVNAALLLTTGLQFSLYHDLAAWQGAIKWFLSLSILWLACAVFFDLYNLALASHTDQTLRTTVWAVLMTLLIYTFTPWVTPPLISRGAVFGFAAVLMVLMLLWRLLYARVFAQPWFKQRALIVGTGPVGQELVYALQNPQGVPSPYHAAGYQLVGMVDARPDLTPQDTISEIDGVPVLGGQLDLLQLVQRLDVDEVIDAITHRNMVGDAIFDAMLNCHELGLRVTSMSTFYERVLGRVPVRQIGHDLGDVIQMEDAWSYRLYGLIKRGLDLVGCLPLLLVLAAIFPLVAVANAFFAPGPLFYEQTRLGRGGKPFAIYKFRSMRPDAEKDGYAVWAQSADCRITPVGRWLRRTRIDELPQVLNVLRGEMSMIGPRPERPEFVDRLCTTIPYYRARHAVRPGLTGWAQVRFRYASSVDDARVKLEYDLYYVKHASPLLDLQILVRTAAIMVQMKGT